MTRTLALALALCIGLCAWLYTRLEEAQKSGAVQKATIEQQSGTIEALENSLALTDRITAGWDADRTNFADLRGVIRKEMKEAMKDASFKAWAMAPVHPDAVRMLIQAAERSGLPLASGRPDAAGSETCPVR